MGRGLSELQRFILERSAKAPRLYYSEILVEYFGWKPGWPLKYEDGVLASPGSHRFSRTKIGEKEYSRVMATLSRSCTRLDNRGLVTVIVAEYSHWTGVVITDQGRAFLSVN
ncbi:hypothetical protein Pan216_12820 [Planctomycetes bacterium Pan216]|uniref:Uncharacterized protein n=1 Tax=Kolteria novifilia TaxID=2527975 RepID=A0A518B0D3_9BACT|nr:hypothetical protein Pan216_12820 [Planctomycetes bacterium Pan216]